ncbi:RagB/SusD family nutrient uptake outer membrane protein [Deminuibacter soli]|nr:RagB/SusD family nutrient uptake outer membrane protein [Deminuibacter soli]
MKRNSSFLYLLVLLVISQSCKKDLNQGPINSTYDQEFWTSKTSAEQGTVAMYGAFRAAIRANKAFFINSEMTSGLFNATDWNLVSLTKDGGEKFPVATTNYLGECTDWTRYYKVISQCNTVLDKVAAMPVGLFGDNNKKNSYIGEALYVRALTYFTMIRIWGDPVYITKTYDNADYGNIPPVARTAETAVLDTCILDLNKAAGYLSFTGGDPSKTTRASKGAAYALMAHIYAWQHKYDDAHKACQQVINSGGYAMESAATYANIWQGKSSAESIFEIPMQFNQNDNNFLNSADGYNDYNDWSEAQFNFFSIFLKDEQVDDLKSTCWLGDTSMIRGIYWYDNDMRFNNMLQYTPASGGDPAGFKLLKYANFKYQNPSNSTNAYVNNNLVLFRLADIYLLDAEALAMTGKTQDAVDALNLVRRRAGIEDYSGDLDQASLVNEIMDERGRELIGEGSWFYDMIRTEPVVHALEGYLGYPADRVTQKGYYWPLDMGKLFQNDPLLTQNPYWASHN